jgi:DNA-binding transcriptional LysR family regulator
MPKAPLSTSRRPGGNRISLRQDSAGQSLSGSEHDESDVNLGSTDLNLLIVFDVLMRERSLTRAGRRLGLSQPATSHALARLRHSLRDDLFVRTPEGMQPTPRAEQMAEPVRNALAALSISLRPDAFDPGSAARDFTIAVNNYAARAIVPALVRDVGGVAPSVSLDIRPIGGLNVIDQLDAGAFDVALSTLVDGGERFRCVRIMEDDYVALLAKGHRAAADAELTAERLAEIPHVILTSTGDDTSFVDEALEQRGLARKIGARVPFLSFVLMLVNSDLIAVTPRRVAQDLTRICPVVVKELPFPSARIGLSMIWHRRVDTHAAHRWLRDVIKAAARR